MRNFDANIEEQKIRMMELTVWHPADVCEVDEVLVPWLLLGCAWLRDEEHLVVLVLDVDQLDLELEVGVGGDRVSGAW